MQDPETAFLMSQLKQVSSGSFAGRFLEASWKHCHSSSRFSLSQFVLFLHVIPDRLDDDDEIRSLYGERAVVRLLVQTKIYGSRIMTIVFET